MDEVDVEFSLAVRSMAMAFVHYRAVVVRTRYGVGPTEGAAMGELFLSGESTPTGLAERLKLTTPAITEVLDRLEVAGHVRRSKHPTDRRKVLVSLSPDARARLERSAPEFAELLAPALRDLNDAERRALVTALERATQAIENDTQARLVAAKS